MLAFGGNWYPPAWWWIDNENLHKADYNAMPADLITFCGSLSRTAHSYWPWMIPFSSTHFHHYQKSTQRMTAALNLQKAAYAIKLISCACASPLPCQGHSCRYVERLSTLHPLTPWLCLKCGEEERLKVQCLMEWILHLNKRIVQYSQHYDYVLALYSCMVQTSSKTKSLPLPRAEEPWHCKRNAL